MLDPNRSALLVIDIQDKLMPKAPAIVEAYLAQIDKLIRVAQALAMPVLVTEQYPEKLGQTTQILQSVLGDTPRIPKMAFGCFGEAAFQSALKATGRSQLIVTGMETHICVLQTVLQALSQGYRPYVLRDAVLSMEKKQYKAGLHRMDRAGAVLATTQMVIFELLQEAGTPRFKKLLPLLK